MKLNRISRTLMAVLCVAPSMAHADYNGTGSVKSECYITLHRVPTPSKNKVVCKDGDACDADGTVDGKCTFPVDVCLHQEGISGCTSPDITSYSFLVKGKNGVVVTDPGTIPVPATAAVCSSTGSIVVPLGSKKVKKVNTPAKSKPVKVVFSAVGSVRPKKDKDTLILICDVGTPPCPANTAGGPNELRFRIKKDGNDLDTGWTGNSHNSLNVFGSSYAMCVNGCDAAGTMPCAEDQESTERINAADFGPPLPLVASGVPTCVRNKYGTPKLADGTANLSTGEVSLTVNLLSQVYITSQDQVCPECSSQTLGGVGSCKGQAGYPDAGKTCKTQGLVKVNGKVYPLSTDCLPSGTPFPALTIPLKPLTTEVSSKMGTGAALCPGMTHNNGCGAGGNADGPCNTTTGCGPNPDNSDPKGGIYQHCCDSDHNKSCFPVEASQASPGFSVTGTRSPLTAVGSADFPKKSTPTLASAFCIAATGSNLVDPIAGLPGPGATTMPVDICWLKADSDASLCPPPEASTIQ